MTAYWIAHVTIHDHNQYQKYTQLAKEVFPKYEAVYLVRDENPHHLEGPSYQRHVIIQFPSMEKALECYHSEEYQNAKKQRERACDVQVTLTHCL